MDNKVDICMTSEAYQTVMDGITALKSQMPFLISLTPEQQRQLARTGDKSLAFVNKCREVSSQRPDILRRSFDIEAFGRDVDLFNQMSNVRTALFQLLDAVDSTRLQAGAEAFAGSLLVYAAVQDVQDGSLATVEADLAQRFARKGKGSVAGAPTSSTVAK